MTTVQSAGPVERPAASTTALSSQRAGFWRRFGAVLLDGLILNVCSLPFTVLSEGLSLAIVVLGQIGYYTALEGGSTGQTVGKMALGIRVIDLAEGGPIGYSRAFIRWIGRIVSACVFLLGYLWMLGDKEKQTWHDKMAGSIVVRTS